MLNDTSKAVDMSEVEAGLSAIITGDARVNRVRAGSRVQAEPEMVFGEQYQAVQMDGRPRVKVDHARDALLTEFGKATCATAI